MIIDRDKARNSYLFATREQRVSKPEPLGTIELPVAAIQQLALYTDMSPLNIAIHLIVNDNDDDIDTIRNMRKMTQELVILTRNTKLDTNNSEAR